MLHKIPTIESPPMDELQKPCIPSPCGPNSQCREVGTTAVCSCLQNYIGRPPNCRPECTINAECAGNFACINERCKDPCPGSCGLSAICNVVNHSPVCVCSQGYTGDPFTACYPSKTIYFRHSILFLHFKFIIYSCSYFILFLVYGSSHIFLLIYFVQILFLYNANLDFKLIF